MPHFLMMGTRSALLRTTAAQGFISILCLAVGSQAHALTLEGGTDCSQGSLALLLVSMALPLLLFLPLQPPLDTPPGMGPAVCLTAPEGTVHPPPSQGICSPEF